VDQPLSGGESRTRSAFAFVLGSTRADLIALQNFMADSAESTLTALAEWVA
jgi:hypothetical protein